MYVHVDVQKMYIEQPCASTGTSAIGRIAAAATATITNRANERRMRSPPLLPEPGLVPLGRRPRDPDVKGGLRCQAGAGGAPPMTDGRTGASAAAPFTPGEQLRGIEIPYLM